MAPRRSRHRPRHHEPPSARAHPAPPRTGRPILRYFLLFGAAAIALFVLYRVSEATHTFKHVNELNAAASAAVLRFVGIPNQRDGTQLLFPTGGLQIISECSAIYIAILYIAGVIAFPTTWRARAWGLVIGVPSILLINVLRLVTLGAVVRYRYDLLPFFHEYLWQVLFVFVVAALYVGWIERFAPRRRSTT
jgi:exosortase H (IPTLxxWG-CTERM-specific)